MGSIAETKHLVLTKLLEQEDFVLLVIDPKVKGVKLPEYLLQAGQPVGINIGWRLAVPIIDLKIDAQGIGGTLSFKRTPHYCFFTWSAILQVSAGEEHLVWVTKRPHESSPKQESAPEPRAKRGKKHLRLVE